MSKLLKGKELVHQYFPFFKDNKKPDKLVEHSVHCKCGWEGKYKTSRGYTNLQYHITNAHPEYASLTSDSKKNQPLIDESFYPEKVKSYWAWLDWVIGDLLPFSFVEKERTRKHSKMNRMGVDTFMKMLKLLTAAVEKKISDSLPSTFALVFDGWTLGQTHYIAVFATYPDDTVRGYQQVLLSFSPLTNEDDMGAESHIMYFNYVLETYGKRWENVAALIGDNCATNRAFAGLKKIPFIGCASLRFNLAVKYYLNQHEDILKKVNDVMLKLKNLIPSAKLRKHTDLKAKTRNVTRWSSTYEMLLRYTQIRNVLPLLELNEIDEKMLRSRENNVIDTILKELQDFDSVTKELQKETTTMADVRVLFDAIAEDYAIVKEKLAVDAPIVSDKFFESAIVKLQQGRKELLNSAEERAVMGLKKLPGQKSQKSDSHENLSYAQRKLKKQKLGISEDDVDYMDARFLLPTSNICERLFSQAGFCLNERRLATLPINAESQMFLRLNMNLWNIDTVNDILRNHPQ